MPYKEPEYKDPKSINQPLFPKTGLQLRCPNCSHHIVADHININSGIAKCNNCNNVFSFEEEIKNPVRKRPEIFLPEEIEILSLSSELNIHYKWRKTKSMNYFLLLFAVVWNIIILPMALVAIGSGNLVALLGMSLHLLVGAGLIVHFLMRFLNTTYITVDDYELAIEHRPISLPFYYKNQYIDIRDIDQLYSQKYIENQSKDGGHKTHAYRIIAKLKGGKEIKILKGLKSKHKALFIEQEIELFLGIKDQPVPGEVG